MNNSLQKFLGESLYLKLLNIYKEITDGHSVKSYSQEGEDLILLREFYGKTKGFYVDVGAYHPKRFSNTFLFYKMGWRGINIDARPGSMKAFRKKRSRDLNLEIPISDKSEELKFYTFNEPAISGFHQELSVERNKKEGYKIIKIEKMVPQRLSDVFDKYLPENQEISFLSIDVEGFDYNVLVSNNWDKYIPKIIVIEELSKTIEDAIQSPISTLLKFHGYVLFAKTPNTSFYRRLDR